MRTSTKTRKAYKKNSAAANGESAQDRALNLFTEMMITRIEEINSDWKKPWFTECSNSWPKNLSDRHYNGMNSFMLLMHCQNQGYKYPVFCTFDRVLGLNFNRTSAGVVPAVDVNGDRRQNVSVRKGEKSFPVFITVFTVVNKYTNEKIKYEDYKLLSRDEQAKYDVFPKLQVYNVFNIDQTNIKEARPEIYEKIVAENEVARPEHYGNDFHFQPLEKMIQDNLWICPIKCIRGDRCYYSPSRHEIVVPEYEQFVDGESFVGNVCHEMAHSTGAKDYLNRLTAAPFGSPEYAKEELVAEMTSALVCQYYGIEKHIKDDSAAYLKSWLKSLKEDAQFIKTILLDVKRASGMMTQHLDEVA